MNILIYIKIWQKRYPNIEAVRGGGVVNAIFSNVKTLWIT